MARDTTNALLCAALLALGGCEEENKLPIGATCQTASECSSGLCGDTICLEPAADDDGDGLINALEVSLGTSALNVDSDGDGVTDPVEVGDVDAPSDGDEDGRIDAVESDQLDNDEDCLVDEVDDQDYIANHPQDREGACGDGSYLGIHVCEHLVKAFRGTCADSLADGFACFDPMGECRLTVDDAGATYTWENGAYHHDGLYASDGAQCVAFAGGGFETRAKESFAFSSSAGVVDEVICPDGTAVPLESSLQYAIYYCVQGADGCPEGDFPDDARAPTP